MCGIFGIVTPPGTSVDRQVLSEGVRIINHRGPDHSDIFYDHNIGLANCRLAVIDPDHRSNQPFCYNNTWITFNGCIYNYRELKSHLMKEGYRFKTSGDTEVILAAYLHWGRQCVNQFNGMWAFCIYDPQKDLVFCSRDRFGIKPFYYTFLNSTFYFGSEIKCFSAIRQWTPTVNNQMAADFILFGLQDHTCETFFNKVQKLPPSHNFLYYPKTNSHKLEKYFHIEKYDKSDMSNDEAISRFREIFYDSVKLRLRSDVEMGACLSGGLDSSSIVSTISELDCHPPEILSLSVFYNLKGFDETEYIDSISSKAKIPNVSFSPSMDSLTHDLYDLIYTLDEPPSSASMFAQYKLFEKAKSLNLRVMLDGQGGDELLAGYDVFYYRQFQWLKKKSYSQLLKAIFYFLSNYEDSFKELWFRYLNFRNKSNHVIPTWFNKKIIKKFQTQNLEYQSISDVSISLIQNMGLQALLHFEDRNSMAHSIESRLPFLDYRLVSFCLGLPDELKMWHGLRKFILREAMKNQLPRKILERKDKMGFDVPQSQWLKHHRSKIREEILHDIKKIPLFLPKSFPESLSQSRIWRIYVFNRWVKRFKMDFEI